MRLSRYPVNTAKETPAEAEVISHQLMLRAGLIRRLAAGVYTFLPIGLRAIRKVEKIVREEMDRAGALELLMPAVQPAELWKESGRWDQYGPELLRLKDRHDRDFVIGPTHEEVITDIARRDLKSYRQLPVNFYQIQMKFRDEIRPRFGIMRGREFLMKDAYSFHADEASLAEGYAAMKQAYTRMFERMGLNFRAVRADTGSIGGTASEEFQVLADSGEDAIAISDADDYAANLELAPTPVFDGNRPAATQAMQSVPTPGARTIAEVSALLAVPADRCVKTLIVEGADGGVVALVIRGDHELNAVKAQKIEGVGTPLRMATAARVQAATAIEPGFLGPVGLNCKVVVDHAAATLADFVCGGNARDVHYTNVNWVRDLPEPEIADLRNVVAGDPSPSGKGKVVIRRGIEVGHIFQLGRKYSTAMKASVLDPAGKPLTPLMGCYGIGVTRVVAAAIEQNHDEKGIIWPEPIAPFTVLLVTLNHDRSEAVRALADSLYAGFSQAGIDVLYDDRDARPGVKFADAELLGIPHCIVIGDRGIAAGRLEYRNRRTGENGEIAVDAVVTELQSRLAR
ncbi:MAG: proline--tRNA ligase [Pseudomonadota bacterium]